MYLCAGDEAPYQTLGADGIMPETRRLCVSCRAGFRLISVIVVCTGRETL